MAKQQRFTATRETMNEDELADLENEEPEATKPRTVDVADEDGQNERPVLAKGPTLSELRAKSALEALEDDAPAAQPEALREAKPVPDPATLALQQAAGEEREPPFLVVGEHRYPCRSKAPGALTAKISSFTAKFAQVAQSKAIKADGSIDQAKIKADDLISLSMAPQELFEVAIALVLPEHREDLTSRWEGAWTDPATEEIHYLPDSDVVEAGDVLPALMDLLPHYTAASGPKA